MKIIINKPPLPGPIIPGAGTPIRGGIPGIGGGIPVGTGPIPRPACIARPIPGIPAPIPGTRAIPTSLKFQNTKYILRVESSF